MSELNYKELQEKGVFDAPYKAFQFMQEQQAIIDDLRSQLNNMEACYIEKKKQVDACAALAAGWSAITWDKTTHWTEGYEEGCYHCSGQIEEALRGGHD